MIYYKFISKATNNKYASPKIFASNLLFFSIVCNNVGEKILSHSFV